MADSIDRLRRFLRELKRRKVYRVAAVYAAVAFVLLQAADLIFPALNIPSWAYSLLVILALFGFPLAVVLAWAFEVTPEGVRRTSRVDSSEAEPTESGAKLRAGYKVLVGLGLIAAAVAGGWYLTGGGGESPEVTEGTVAVMPFEVSGSGAEDWRNGMVSLLSTGLDGAVGLRAIADRTVFAAWDQRASQGAAASTDEALSVARRTGAQYAVVGTAVGLGSKLQLSATAYETASRKRLGHVEVSGPPDSVTALAGELTRRVLGLLATQTGQGLRAADLASVTTRSDSALRAFLAGEQHLRNAEVESAVMAYKAAIRADSGFALPYARIGRRGAWHGATRGQYIRHAHELSDQLPPRQRRLVRALYLAQIDRRTVAAGDSLRRLTEDYPDDPSIWENLGELVAHVEIPKGVREVETTHERAVELDPGHAPHYDHYVEAAFHLQRDSAVVASRVAEVPDAQWRRLYRLGVEVLFGDSTRRQQAVAAYDTVSIPEAPWPVWAPYLAPQYAKHLDTVLRRVLERKDVDRRLYRIILIESALRQGQVDRALARIRSWQPDRGSIACVLAAGMTSGLPVPDSTAARHLAPENLPTEPSLDRFRCTGLYLVESGRGDELDGLIQRLRMGVDTTGPDGVSPGQRQAVIQELRGYRAWKQDEMERAAEFWARSNESGFPGALWRGDLYRQLGRLEMAESWYSAAWRLPESHHRLGQLYEEMGEPEKAAAAYRRFMAAWEDADEELQPRVEAAQERLTALMTDEGETDE